jgi:hypothetical protein
MSEPPGRPESVQNGQLSAFSFHSFLPPCPLGGLVARFGADIALPDLRVKKDDVRNVVARGLAPAQPFDQAAEQCHVNHRARELPDR